MCLQFLWLLTSYSSLLACPLGSAINVLFSDSVMSDSLQPHELHIRLPCPSPLFKLMSIELMRPYNHLILCRPLLLLPSISASISRPFPMSWLFTDIRRPNYWTSASASVLPMNIQDWFPLGLTGLISLLFKGFSSVFSSTTVQKHQFFCIQLSSQSNSHIHTWPWKKHSLD